MSTTAKTTTQPTSAATSELTKKEAKHRPARPLQQTFAVLDVQQLCASSPQAAVSQFTVQGKPKVVRCDIMVAGGGMGGIAAAIRAAQTGARVCVTEETDWIGGQATAQGVSALDENYLVETSGATRMYQDWRQAIRRYYREFPGASEETAANETLNPGNCWVTWLSFEPQVGLNKLYELISRETKTNPPEIFLRHKVVATRVVRGRVLSLLSVNLDSGQFVEFRPRFCIDATELGDILPLVEASYNSGAEPFSQTNEAHAPATANVENVQDFVYPFVVEFRDGEKHIIEKPDHYDRFRKEGRFSFAGYKMFENAQAPGRSSEYLPFWTYRRLIAKDNYPNSTFKYDVAMINWESNDLRGENIIDKAPLEQAERLALAKDLSLGFLYWMQTEAPRDDSIEKGYPELFLRTDVLGTSDGLSKYPYIRESRRIAARKIVREEEIAAAANNGSRAKRFEDTVGIGLYPIDIHGAQDVSGAGQAAKPFQIPLGSIVQSDVRNLIPACKNIGTTHVTNGAYRLHPVEWAIGEAAGTLAAFCLKNNTMPFKVAMSELKIRSLQNEILSKGAPIFWFDDVPTDHDYFEAIQFVSATGLMEPSADHLHFYPDQPASPEEARQVLEKACGKAPSPEILDKAKTRAQLAQAAYHLARPRKAR